MLLAEDWVMSLDLDDPSAREAALGPAGATEPLLICIRASRKARVGHAKATGRWVPLSCLRNTAYRPRVRCVLIPVLQPSGAHSHWTSV